MKKIVGILRPFQFEQSFFVYEDGEKIDEANPTVEEINSTVFNFISKYEDIKQMDLAGPKQYIQGIKQNYQTEEMSKYNFNKLEINII